MAFRQSIPQEELRDQLTAEEQQRHETVYSASQGGCFPQVDKPVPGTSQASEQGREL